MQVRSCYYAYMPFVKMQVSHCQGKGWNEVGTASYRTMNAVLLLWVTTDSLLVVTEEETVATCGHLLQRPSPCYGGVVPRPLTLSLRALAFIC